MKKLIFIICIFLSVLHCRAEDSSRVFFIRPIDTENPITSNFKIDSIFNVYSVIHHKPFSNLENKDLANTYEIFIHNYPESFMKDLLNTNKIEFIESMPFPKVGNNCSQPAIITDPFILENNTNVGTWQLDSINVPCAWTITKGDPNISIAVIDTEFNLLHEDLIGRFNSIWNPFNLVITNPANCFHGTAVSSIINANADNNIGLAGVAPLSKINGYVVKYNNSCYDTPPPPAASTVQSLSASIIKAYENNERIINLSWLISCSGGSNQTYYSLFEELTNNGTSIVLAAGNSPDALCHADYANIPGVILVSGINNEGKIGPTNLARNEFIDICATGGGAMVARGNNINTYFPTSNSTSASAPFVSGTIALMLSVNPCLSPKLIEEIIKITADPINDAEEYIGLHGAGKLNVYKAVKYSQDFFNNNFDLYIKDIPLDAGVEPANYPLNTPLWMSEDIWTRQYDDNIFEHQNVYYNSSSQPYIYVRVRNRGCIESTGADSLKIYYAKGGPYANWPWPWTNTTDYPPYGREIASVIIPSIPPASDTIIKIQWTNLPNFNIYNNDFLPPYDDEIRHFCILARIISNTDNMHNEINGNSIENTLANNIRNNNNIAMKNVNIIDFMFTPNGILNNHATISVGNSLSVEQLADIEFNINDNLLEHAEVRIILDGSLSNKIQRQNIVHPGIKRNTSSYREYILTSNLGSFKNVNFQANEINDIKIYVNFLTSSPPNYEEEFILNITQVDTEKHITNGNNFTLIPPDRIDFFTTKIDFYSENQIYSRYTNEPVFNNWYILNDSIREFIVSNDTLNITNLNNKPILLETISKQDGYKSYDTLLFSDMHFVLLNTKNNDIISITPNPFKEIINIKINAQYINKNNQITIICSVTGKIKNFVLSSDEIIINTSELSSGVYIINYLIDNQLVFTKKALKL